MGCTEQWSHPLDFFGAPVAPLCPVHGERLVLIPDGQTLEDVQWENYEKEGHCAEPPVDITADDILIQYLVPMDAIAAIPHDVQRSQMQLGGSLSPVIHQMYAGGGMGGVADLISPGFRPPVFRGQGDEMPGRDGDFVVKSSYAYQSTDGGPFGVIFVCMVAYDPVPESEQCWGEVRSLPLN